MNKIVNFLVLLFLISSDLSAQYNSVLSSGEWYRISTQQEGIYKIDYNDLINLGVNIANLRIQDVKLYGNGGGMLPKLNSDFRYDDLAENAIKAYDFNNDGYFGNEDYIIFYGQSPNQWSYDTLTELFKHEIHLFSDYVYYFLTVNNQSPGKRIQQKHILSNPTKIITTYNDFAFHEKELENLIQSGSQWFGERFDYQKKQSFSFSFPNLDQNYPISIKSSVCARSLTSSAFALTVNNTSLTSINIPNIVSEYATEYAKIKSETINYNSITPNLNIELEYISSDNSAIGWLNYIEINLRRKLIMSGNLLQFRNAHSNSEEIGRFDIQNALSAVVWDVSNPTNITVLSTFTNQGFLSFNDSLNSIKEYICFSNTDYLSPNFEGEMLNQNLHNLQTDIEYIIISHPDFLDAANRLGKFHELHDGLNYAVVTPSQIYNEFSSGMQDVTAIRDFARMLYERPNSQLKYLLLFGDGSYDPKNRIAENTNYILTYQSNNSTHPTKSYVTDDFFALLDSTEGHFIDDLVDIGVGRLPVSSISEANIVVDKIERYYNISSFGSWRNDITFIADDGDANDGNTHMSQADSLANIVENTYRDINIKKIYLDNYFQESTPGGPRSQMTQDAITNKIQKGSFLINYTGHGGPLGWAQERILEIDQINSWENSKLPLFMTATCKFSYFDNPESKSAGEYVLLNERGGAIALLSTTRLVYSVPNYNLNKKFINNIFEKNNGAYLSLGDLFKKTKVLSGTGINNRNFTLLGDPALRLAHPSFDIQTTILPDTFKALSEVTIEGEVVDDIFGNRLNSFNGTVFPTVFDKTIIKETLGQQSCTPMPYNDQSNILYRGSASVINGKFSFSFIVPKDIAYNYDYGKISYYAFSDQDIPVDAKGSYESFIIGGTANDIIYDYNGPDANLYMNTREFKRGGITDKNPTLIADIYDISGINTVGNGIGHDIIAILDGNSSQPYILNEYYTSAKDDYTKGSIEFPFVNLEEGKHTITLKLWDVFNNSTEQTIDFVVTNDSQFIIEDYISYPNPFTNTTAFYFQHNKSDQDLTVIIEIFSVTGQLVKTIKSNYFDNGYRIGPIIWDGTDNFGSKLNAGIYIAQLKLISPLEVSSSNSIRIILIPE